MSGAARGDVTATARSTFDGTSARLGYARLPSTEDCRGCTIKVEPRNPLFRNAERVCWPIVVSSAPMIATVFGLKIGSREPAFPSDVFGEALGEIGTRLASADILLTDF
jgi:hypothetical protein